MRLIALLVFVALASFAAGLAVNSSGAAQKVWFGDQTAQMPITPTSTRIPCPQEDKFQRLVEDKHITQFNGTKLKLNYDDDVPSEDIPGAISSAKVTPLRDGSLIVSLGDALYRLDHQHRIVWHYEAPQRIFDYAYIESMNLIYATAGDNFMLILDAANGKDLYADSRNGSAWYGVARPYGDDMALVTDYFRWYRERSWDFGVEPTKDGITCWRGTKKLWHQDFPPDAELLVSGKRIFAITKSKKAIYVNEIFPPQTKK